MHQKYTSDIYVNGVRKEGNDYAHADRILKIEVVASKIKSQNIQVVYTIRVTNSGKVAGKVGKVTDTIPSGFKFNALKNKAYWQVQNNNVVTTTELANKVLKPGEYADLQITLDWVQSDFNFGTKTNVVTIGEFSNNPGFEDEDKNNNNAQSSILFSIKTGGEIVLAKQITIIILIAIIVIGTLALIEVKIIQKRDKDN